MPDRPCPRFWVFEQIYNPEETKRRERERENKISMNLNEIMGQRTRRIFENSKIYHKTILQY